MSASTVILNGLTAHDYGTYYPYFAIRNDSGGVVYASTTDPECTPDTEGVVSIANGDGYMAANTDHDNTCLYLSGTGKVTVIAQHDKIFPFKKAQGGGDNETVIDTTINAESTNAHAAGSKAVHDFVTAAIAGVGTFRAEIVEELPLVGASNILYLVAKASSESGNVYDEYLYIGGAWELIGSTDIDLSGYAKSSEMYALAAEINGKIPTSLSSFGLTATAAELNYCDGVTSNIQTQLNSKAKTSDLNSYLPLSGGGMTGSIASSSSYSVIMENADSMQYKFPIMAKNSDDSPFMRIATSHTSSENGLLLQISSPSGTMAALNIYSGTSGKRITTDCELPKNYVTGTFAISSSSTSATVTLGFEPSFVVLHGGAMQAYTGTAWITSTGFKTQALSSVYSGTWTYIAFK